MCRSDTARREAAVVSQKWVLLNAGLMRSSASGVAGVTHRERSIRHRRKKKKTLAFVSLTSAVRSTSVCTTVCWCVCGLCIVHCATLFPLQKLSSSAKRTTLSPVDILFIPPRGTRPLFCARRRRWCQRKRASSCDKIAMAKIYVFLALYSTCTRDNDATIYSPVLCSHLRFRNHYSKRELPFNKYEHRAPPSPRF